MSFPSKNRCMPDNDRARFSIRREFKKYVWTFNLPLSFAWIRTESGGVMTCRWNFFSYFRAVVLYAVRWGDSVGFLKTHSPREINSFRLGLPKDENTDSISSNIHLELWQSWSTSPNLGEADPGSLKRSDPRLKVTPKVCVCRGTTGTIHGSFGRKKAVG